MSAPSSESSGPLLLPVASPDCTTTPALHTSTTPALHTSTATASQDMLIGKAPSVTATPDAQAILSRQYLYNTLLALLGIIGTFIFGVWAIKSYNAAQDANKMALKQLQLAADPRPEQIADLTNQLLALAACQYNTHVNCQYFMTQFDPGAVLASLLSTQISIPLPSSTNRFSAAGSIVTFTGSIPAITFGTSATFPSEATLTSLLEPSSTFSPTVTTPAAVSSIGFTSGRILTGSLETPWPFFSTRSSPSAVSTITVTSEATLTSMLEPSLTSSSSAYGGAAGLTTSSESSSALSFETLSSFAPPTIPLPTPASTSISSIGSPQSLGIPSATTSIVPSGDTGASSPHGTTDLSLGAIVAIGVSAIVVVAALTTAVAYSVFRRARRKRAAYSAVDGENVEANR